MGNHMKSGSKISPKSDWFNNQKVQERLKEAWKEEGEYFQVCFEEVIDVLKAHHKKYNDQIQNRQFITRRYQSMIGAHGIGKTAINIGLCTLAAKKDREQGEKTVKDHVFGYTTTAKKVVNDFVILKGKIDDGEWLRNYFHLWLVIEVSKREHRRENILRSDQESGDNIEYDHKLKLKHYKNVSELYIRNDFKIISFNSKFKKELVNRRKTYK